MSVNQHTVYNWEFLITGFYWWCIGVTLFRAANSCAHTDC